MYTEKVMENFTNPKNVGEIEEANAVGQVGSPACGDIMKMSMKINDDGIIEDVKFKTYGCGAAIATSSVATEMIKGKSVDEARKLTNDEVIEQLGGLPPQKIHCSVLAAEAIQAALEDWEKNKNQAAE
ncbi:MAG: Fe-S cluster assembly scaffold protein NifU [Eubacteriaceae bacterium]|jgi:nitrogen fixation NifU-like protein